MRKGRFKLTRIIFLGISFILVLGMLFGCREKPTDQYQNLFDKVEFKYEPGDSSKNITTNFQVPIKIDGSKITWTSNYKDIIKINDDGIIEIKRTDQDQVITLTATIEKDGKTYQETYKFTIKKQDEVIIDENITITFECEGIEPIVIKKGDSLTLPNGPDKEGYKFLYWSLEPGGSMFQGLSDNQKEVKLYPIYQKLDDKPNEDNKYIVKFLVDGSQYGDLQEVLVNSLVVKPTNPLKTGYKFLGWTLEGLEDLVNLDTYKITQDSVFEAKFSVDYMYYKVGAFAEGTKPAWVLDPLETKTAFREAVRDNFDEIPAEYVKSFDFGRTRVMLYQRYGNSGGVVISVLENKPILIKDVEILDLLDQLDSKPESERFTILGTFKQGSRNFYVTDKDILYCQEGTIKKHTYSVGKFADSLPNSKYFIPIKNDFHKAYKMAPFNLGLPENNGKTEEYTIRKLNDDGTTIGNEEATYKYFVQQFSNGYIMQGRQASADGTQIVSVQHGAAPITNEIYNAVKNISNNQTFNITGMPVSIHFDLGDYIVQNFEFGYIKFKKSDSTIKFVEGLVVDKYETEMNRRIGSSASFTNWYNNGASERNRNDYLQAWERLRIGMNLRNTMGEMIREGRKPYTTDGQIHFTPHEMDNNGVQHVYKAGVSGGVYLGHGNCTIFQSYWYLPAFEVAPKLNKEVSLKENKTQRGLPIAKWGEEGNIQYQQLEYGLLYYNFLNDSYTFMNQTQFNNMMQGHDSIDEALVSANISTTGSSPIRYSYAIDNTIKSKTTSQINNFENKSRYSLTNKLKEKYNTINNANLWTYGGYLTALSRVYEAYPTTENLQKLNNAIDELESEYRVTRNNGGYVYYASEGNRVTEPYYDDNAWVALAFVRAYQTTKKEAYLNKAKEMMTWIYTGWNNEKGGIYWRKYKSTTNADKRERNTCSTAPTGWISAMLYKLTNDNTYLEWAKKCYDWTKNTLFDKEHYAYKDNIDDLGNVAGALWAYNSGTMLSLASYLYDITKDFKYKQHALELICGTYKVFSVSNSLAVEKGGIKNGLYLKNDPWFRMYLISGYLDAFRFVSKDVGIYLESLKKAIIHGVNNHLETENNRKGIMKYDWVNGTISANYDELKVLYAIGNIETLAIMEIYQQTLNEIISNQ